LHEVSKRLESTLGGATVAYRSLACASV